MLHIVQVVQCQFTEVLKSRVHSDAHFCLPTAVDFETHGNQSRTITPSVEESQRPMWWNSFSEAAALIDILHEQCVQELKTQQDQTRYVADQKQKNNSFKQPNQPLSILLHFSHFLACRHSLSTLKTGTTGCLRQFSGYYRLSCIHISGHILLSFPLKF